MKILVYIKGAQDQRNKPNESTSKSKDIRTFFNKERNVVAHSCSEKKNHCNRLIFKFENLLKDI